MPARRRSGRPPPAAPGCASAGGRPRRSSPAGRRRPHAAWSGWSSPTRRRSSSGRPGWWGGRRLRLAGSDAGDGLRRRVRRPSARRRLERHPADAVEPHLGPGMGVGVADVVEAGRVAVALGEADGDAARKADLAGQDGEGGRELLAEPGPRPGQEVDERVLRLVGRDVEAVGERWAPQPVLEHARRRVRVLRPEGVLLGEPLDDQRDVVGQLEVLLQVGPGRVGPRRRPGAAPRSAAGTCEVTV